MKSNFNLKYNIIFIFLFFLMLFAGDIFLILIGRLNVVINNVFDVLFLILIVFGLSFCNKYIKIIITTIATIFIAVGLNHITYFGEPIRHENVYAIFTLYGDIFECFSYVWFIEPFILIPYFCVLFFSIAYDKKIYHSKIFTLLLMFSIFLICKKAYNHGQLYAEPIKTRATIFNSIRTFPWMMFHFRERYDDNYPIETTKPFYIKSINSKKLPRIVFLIWGESTNVDYLSLFGESKFIGKLKTTPKLEKIVSSEKNKYVLLKSLSGGCETTGSTTLFFNLFNEPANFIKIAKDEKQNLFNLAKQHGYTTHWISVAETNVMSVGKMPADHLVTKDTHIALPRMYRDDYILDQVKNLDLSKGRHFVVIQFHSLHEKYDSNYARHKEYEYFKKNKNDNRTVSSRKKYINNVFYLDYLLSEVVKFAKNNDADYILYTSDHGETIGTDFSGENDGILFGHNYLGFLDMIVPFMLYQKNPNNELKKELERKKIIAHAEISVLIAKILGFEVKRPNEEKDVFFMYESCSFSKTSKIKKVKRNNGKFIELYNGTILDYFKQKYNFN